MGNFSGQQFSGQQFSALGRNLANGAKAVGQGAIGNLANAYNRYRNLVHPPNPQTPAVTDPTGMNVPQNPYSNGTDSVVGYPTQASDEGQSGDGSIAPQPMAHGQLVTKPTIALLGEDGPEKIIPLNADPRNKVNGMNPYSRGAY